MLPLDRHLIDTVAFDRFQAQRGHFLLDFMGGIRHLDSFKVFKLRILFHDIHHGAVKQRIAAAEEEWLLLNEELEEEMARQATL